MTKEEKENEKLWNDFEIELIRVARVIPDNKIYAVLKVKPESARRIIQKFQLLVDGSNRGEFESYFEYISISGFDINERKEVSVTIQANPINKNWGGSKGSNSCDFVFTGRRIGLNPVARLEWNDGKDPNVNILIKWHHINDELAQKYILCMDDKEIQYINRREFFDVIETCVHGLPVKKKYTFQIKLRLKNRQEKNLSDLIYINVPETKDQLDMEVLNVYNEIMPIQLLNFVELEKEEKASMRKTQDVDPVLRLYRKLEKAIEARNY